MRVPVSLVNAFKTEFEPILIDFLMQNEFLPEKEALKSKRFLTRSVTPHVLALSQIFNRVVVETSAEDPSIRVKKTHSESIDQESYWAGASNPKNRKLAYMLSFMPCNLFRVASVWGELHRLGFKWPFGENKTGATTGEPGDLPAPVEEFRGIEFGAGTASGACGILAGEKYAPVGLPARGSFALVEQSKATLTLGAKWFEHFTGMTARPFHRRMELGQRWLPESAPKFHLFVMSYFLNETDAPPENIVKFFIQACQHHLEQEGMVIIVEPALKAQSRKLLEFRRALLAHPRVQSGDVPLKVLLPCLGHQACGALAKEDDWCHEEISWWRPPYLRDLDALTGLDRKSLPFSYLVIQKTNRSLEEILPGLLPNATRVPESKTETSVSKNMPSKESFSRYRLVSPSHSLSKKTCEFFICGQDGKRRARYNVPAKTETPMRGDILNDVALHGDRALTQIEKASLVLGLDELKPESDSEMH